MYLKYLFLAILYLSTGPAASCKADLLQALDQVLASDPEAAENKERQLAELKNILAKCSSMEDQYNANMELYRAYLTYSIDSALSYLNNSIILAEKLRNNERIIDTQLSRAFLYCYSGHFKEAVDILKRQNVDGCSDWLRTSYFHLTMTIYQYLAESAIDKPLADYYRSVSETARDSVLRYIPNDTILLAERLASKGDYTQAIHLLSNDYPDGQTSRQAGIRYYVLSEIYGKQGNSAKQKGYLAMAAISDLHNSIREYIALRKLAILLYTEGDIDRAYTYIKRCIDDANACNARQRILEVSQALPIINKAYEKNEESKNRKLAYSLAAISVLAILLVIMLILAAYQMRKITKAREIQNETNRRLSNAYNEQSRLNSELKALNDELTVVNSELNKSNKAQSALNDKLTESDSIKNEYIVRFMNLCSNYLAKMERYRLNLNKIASKRNFDNLYDAVKSTRFINDEIEEFYHIFDEAFLRLFPNFINGLNKLLIPTEQFKETKSLNTELRIFALLRLGITDSAIVTEFLRCSASTLYNYRVKMKNKAISRESFENDIMAIV